MAALTAVVASWVLGTSLRLPPKVPMAVRAALTTKISRVLMRCLQSLLLQSCQQLCGCSNRLPSLRATVLRCLQCFHNAPQAAPPIWQRPAALRNQAATL